MTTTEREYLVMSVIQHEVAMRDEEKHRKNVIVWMRKCYVADPPMTIVELAKISGFSRPTVMKYVQDATTATVET